jgi:tryptophan-rich sensory protein
MVRLAIFIIICEIAGIIGSIFTTPAITSWYQTLNKPFFTPPSWLFAPVWLALYALMGISAYLVYEKGISHKKVRNALIIFAVQLGLNILWSAIFFGLKNPLWGFVEIVALWLAILLTIIYFYRVSKPAGLILVPYILWVTVASALNLFVILLN